MVKTSSFPLDGNVLGAIASAACGLLVGWWLRGMKSNHTKDEKSENKSPINLNDEDVTKYDSGGEFKLVIVVRQDLKMGKGKIAAQCSHAAVAAYKKLYSKDKTLLQCWEYCGQPKVVVKCQDEEELMALFHHAKAVGVTTTVIHDAGRTQISPGSKTVVGVGPAPEDKVNMITGHLRLL